LKKFLRINQLQKGIDIIMLDTDFCMLLEGEISKAFANSSNDKIKRFWCDGVLLPTFKVNILRTFLNDNRKITVTVFAGQDKYELTIHFGNKALSRYARGLNISESVPKPEEQNWFSIDTEQLKMDIQLL